MQFVRIGNRTVNVDLITHASFDADSEDITSGTKAPETVLSFGRDDCAVFYGDEAIQVWRKFCELTSGSTIEVTAG